VTPVLVDLRWSQGRPAGIGLYIRDMAIALNRQLPVRGLVQPGDRPSVPFELAVLPTVPNFRFDIEEALLARRLGSPLITLSRLPVLLAPKLAMPMIFDLSPLILPETHPAIRGFFERSTYGVAARARTIVTISETSRRDLMERLSISADKICVVRPGRPDLRELPDRIERLRELGVTGPYVLSVGTLEPRKNLQVLVDAFATALGDLPVQLVVVGGPGWKQGPILETMRPLQQSGQLRYLGYVDEADKALLYRHAMCLAYPSLYEGFGLPILEAMTYGIPALVSTAPACLEVAGTAGVAIDPRDSRAWAKAIRRLLQEPARRADLGRRGIERAQQFSWAESIRPLIERLSRDRLAEAA
jgi:glycosyltransferase involved in cell wall biosynthesis